MGRTQAASRLAAGCHTCAILLAGTRLVRASLTAGAMPAHPMDSRTRVTGTDRCPLWRRRLSLVHFRRRFFLYARANPATHSQRFVQMTSSFDSDVWEPFQQISLADCAPTEGNIYFFAAQARGRPREGTTRHQRPRQRQPCLPQVNPVHESSLLAVFPLEHRRQGCLAFACSLDGLRWSKPLSLLSCEVRRCVRVAASRILLTDGTGCAHTGGRS